MAAWLDELDELEAAATPAPWAQHDGHWHAPNGWSFDGTIWSEDGYFVAATDNGTKTAALTVKSRNALRPLIDIARAVERFVAEAVSGDMFCGGVPDAVVDNFTRLLARPEASDSEGTDS